MRGEEGRKVMGVKVIKMEKRKVRGEEGVKAGKVLI